jgi:formylglycine-generating enzyme required for sulfatase activity
LVDLALATGSYTLVVERAGSETVRAPIIVERDSRVELEVKPPPKGSVPEGFAYVPPGSFLYGSKVPDESIRIDFYQAVPIHRRSVPGFYISKTETTIGEWLAFVDQQAVTEQLALVPALESVSGERSIGKDGGSWRIVLQTPNGKRYNARWGEPIQYAGRTRRARQDWRRFPITGVLPAEIARYVAWLDKTGKVPGARLCTELEWEYAARGVDGRSYPHGKSLEVDDANYDVTYGREAIGLDEVGSHPTSASPFGLLDMSGNAFEWVLPSYGVGFVVRGGSFWNDRKTANLANRSEVPANARDLTLGARICATLPGPAPR